MLDDRARSLVEDFLHTLPCTNFVFAYGSAVFSQNSASDVKCDVPTPMLDIILLVQDALDWHKENIELNRSHYGPIASLGARTVQRIASNFGTGLHFNPFISFGTRTLKYGVISTVDAQRDLHTWEHMYVAGRMHKPIQPIFDTSVCKCVQQAILSNRFAAITAAVLVQQDQRFTIQQLLRTIVNLSYAGDVRMALAEDSNKVDNIVTGSMQLLQEIYSRDILQEGHLGSLSASDNTDSANQKVFQKPSYQEQQHWVASLPSAALCESAARQRVPFPVASSATGSLELGSGQLCSICKPQRGMHLPDMSPDVRQELADRLCHTGPPSLWLPGALAALVARSSRRQALAGLLVTNPGKSLAYLGAKLTKRFRSLF